MEQIERETRLTHTLQSIHDLMMVPTDHDRILLLGSAVGNPRVRAYGTTLRWDEGVLAWIDRSPAG